MKDNKPKNLKELICLIEYQGLLIKRERAKIVATDKALAILERNIKEIINER